MVFMKNFRFLIVLVLFSTPAAAQGPGWRLENFDIAGAIKVEVSTPPGNKIASSSKNKIRFVAEKIPTITHAPGKWTNKDGLDGYTTGDGVIDRFVVESATRHGLDPLLIYAIMHQESSFRRRAISSKGASGLMQLMPQTAARMGVSNIFDPKQNVEGGARYMRMLLRMFDGDVALALAGYNAGEGAVIRFGRRIPPYRETQEYVRRITKRYSIMRDPESARRAISLSEGQAVALQNPQIPLSLYERTVFAVRLPDGSLRLMSQ